MTTTSTIAKTGGRLPLRVKRILDLAQKLGLKVEERDHTLPDSVSVIVMRSWTISSTRNAWDTSQIWINWTRFGDQKGMGRVTVTWYKLTGKTSRVTLKSAFSLVHVFGDR